MKMFKNILTLICLMLCSASFADNAPDVLVLKLKDSSSLQKFLFEQTPQVNIELNSVIVLVDGEEFAKYPCSNVEKFYFERQEIKLVPITEAIGKADEPVVQNISVQADEDAVAITMPESTKSDDMIFMFRDNQLSVSGLEKGAVASVYDATGRLVYSANVSDGKISYSTESLQSGVYIVKIGNKSYKLLKR